jgi:hypothetical protein
LLDSKSESDNVTQRQTRTGNGHCKCLSTAVRCSSNQKCRTYLRSRNCTDRKSVV